MNQSAPSSDATRVARPLHRSPRLLRGLLILGMSLAVGVLLLALAGSFHRKVPREGRMPETVDERDGRESVPVEVLRRPRYEQAAGTIKPVHEVSLAAKLLARVVEVRVKAGQHVEAGEVLVQLDDADLQSRLRQAGEALNAASARKSQAEGDFERAKSLKTQRAISQSEFDQAEAAAAAVTADWERASQAVEEARIVLAYTTLVAPMAGTVVEKRIEAGDTVSPGQVLLTLYDPTRMQMVASVRESLALRLSVGQMLSARLESLGYECEARVSEIVPEAQSASRSFTVKVTGPCPPGVYSGMFGRLLLPLEDEEILVVPATAVRRVGQLTMVDVVDGGRSRRRSVQTGRRLEGQVEILAGLQAGERVLSGKPAVGENRDVSR